MDHHNEAVRTISSRVKEFHTKNKPFQIYDGSTKNTTRRTNRSPESTIDISNLNSILSINPETKTCLVEPNVPMEALVQETLEKHNLFPPVVLEFPGITCGSAYTKTGAESSSFRHGTFDRIVTGVEIILADGDIVWASADNERCDLFNASAGAFNTLGIITLLEVQLIPVKTGLVSLRYHPISSASEAVDKFREFCNTKPDITTGEFPWDYVDGIMFSATSGVVITGKLLDYNEIKQALATARYTRAINNWYYRAVQEKLIDHPDGWTNIVPLEEYLFRYERGAFWRAGQSQTFEYLLALAGLPLTFNTLTRWLLAVFFNINIPHATQPGTITQQDLCLPSQNLPKFISSTDHQYGVGIWPLVLCPLKPNTSRGPFQLSSPSSPSLSVASSEEDLYITVGIWGPVTHATSTNKNKTISTNKHLEQIVHKLQGFKWLHSQTFYTEEEEFWKIYPKEKYESLRLKYRATSLPSIYDEVKIDIQAAAAEREGLAAALSAWWRRIIWPLGVLVGLFAVITGLGRI